MNIRPATPADVPTWTEMRCLLWPDGSRAEHEAEAHAMLQQPRERVLVSDEGGIVNGFIEARLRDYAEGCNTSPVGYIEGWFVMPGARNRGIGRALVVAAEHWARSQGCTEMASDALIENALSHQAHARLGYAEVERIVCFRKSL